MSEYTPLAHSWEAEYFRHLVVQHGWTKDDSWLVDCSVCRREFIGYVPRGGDGTMLVVSRHKHMTNGHREWCPGSNRAVAERGGQG